MTKRDKARDKQDGFYGTPVLGERVQVVIPVKAREAFRLERGEQLLVFGMGKNMITLVKVEKAKQFASRLAEKSRSIKLILENLTESGGD